MCLEMRAIKLAIASTMVGLIITHQSRRYVVGVATFNLEHILNNTHSKNNSTIYDPFHTDLHSFSHTVC